MSARICEPLTGCKLGQHSRGGEKKKRGGRELTSANHFSIPGIPPTGRKISVPMTSIVNIRGDRLYHEHIAWDQGTVLRQLRLLPEYLPFPYALPDGREPGNGLGFEYRVPVAGVETARKMVDENALPSNEMLEYAVREVKKE